jgi:UPF0716 protein FxsA
MFILSQRIKSYFIAIAILEVAAFIMVASWIGVFRCIVLMCLTSAIGFAMLKRCGLSLPQPGKPPTTPPLKPGLLLAIILIIIPGFVSDIAGLILLIPQLRTLISRMLLFSSVKQPKQPIKKRDQKQSQPGDVIEGEVISEEDSAATDKKHQRNDQHTDNQQTKSHNNDNHKNK